MCITPVKQYFNFQKQCRLYNNQNNNGMLHKMVAIWNCCTPYWEIRLASVLDRMCNWRCHEFCNSHNRCPVDAPRRPTMTGQCKIGRPAGLENSRLYRWQTMPVRYVWLWRIAQFDRLFKIHIYLLHQQIIIIIIIHFI